MIEDNILEMKNICKRFPGVVALDKISFTVKKGEIHCLVGENGAGKSTLMKILAGAYKKDEGEILINGKSVEIDSPLKGQKEGISIVYQELKLAPSLSVAENIFMGRIPVKKVMGAQTNIIDWTKLHKDAEEVLSRLHFKINPRVKVRSLTAAQKQMVEIAKAISLNSKIIILDEPTTSLTSNEIKDLFNILELLRNQNVGIIYISHRLDEIFEIGDRASVLKDGTYQGTVIVKQATKQQIIKMMVGRDVGKKFPERVKCENNEEILRAENLTRKGVLNNISFALNKGEILGLSGLVGAGRTEIVRAIFGADNIDSGSIYVKKQKVNIKSPKDAVRLNIGFVTEDRKEQGLLLTKNVRHNITLSSLDKVSKMSVVSKAKEDNVIDYFIKSLSIKTPSKEQLVNNLSGGNQQKVVLSKWLARGCDIMIFDEPTKGIDVGSKEEFYFLINDLAKQGVGIIFISGELPEILGMSDRILVIKDGSIVKEFNKNDASEENIMIYATGGKDNEYVS